MTSRINTAIASIVTLWNAAEPPTHPNIPYRRATALAQTNGVISARQYYFAAPKGGRTTEFGPHYSVVEHLFDAVVRLEGSNRTFETLFEACTNEPVLLMNTINFYTGWSNGVRFVRADSFRIEPTDSGDFDLVIAMVAEVEEIDGA